jgi:ABC-type antimicrobial peptide transport system permease subunit
MVLRRAGGATLVGIIGGVALGAAGLRVLESRVDGLSSATTATYLLAAVALGLTALLAAYAPVRRATTVDPVEAMRVE